MVLKRDRHARVIVAAVLLGTPNARSHSPVRPPIDLVFPPSDWATPEDAFSASIPGVPVDFQVPDIPSRPIAVPQTRAVTRPTTAPAPFTRYSGEGDLSGPFASRRITEHAPEILSGPLPRYPDLLRQAGVEGRVVLQAIVDTTGRIVPRSVVVVAATNPGFVAAALQALETTLFRPARIDGRAVRVQVRIPFEFTLRGGTGPAR